MMSSALNNVVVNPPWNVPPTLARDILPKAWNDPGYLSVITIPVIRGWNSKRRSIRGWLTGQRLRRRTCHSVSSRHRVRITRWGAINSTC